MTQLREGLGYVRTTPVVLLAVLVVGLVATVGMNFTSSSRRTPRAS